MIEITLTNFEWIRAAYVGVQRQMHSIIRGNADAHGWRNRDGYADHIEGACGELAAAKALGTYWPGHVNVYHGEPDLPPNVEVRMRSRHDYELIVRPSDPTDRVYLLVTGRAPTFRVHGWYDGAAARRDEWSRTHGGRPAAWFVPQSALLPIEDIARRVAA